MTAWASIESAIVDILSDVLDESAAKLRSEPIIAAHAWDSLTSLRAFAEIERRLKVTLDLHRYHEARTIDDLVGLVMNAVATRAAAPR
jgi:acyl carrier protein